MKLSLQLAVLAAGNIGISFILQWVIFIQLGPGIETDAYFAGMTIPQLFFVVISGSLTHVLVPLLSGKNEQQIRNDAWAFMALIGGIFFCLALLLFATSAWWVPLTVPGFDEAAQQLTITLAQIHILGMIFNAINNVQFAVYHVKHQFLWIELSSFITGAIALAFMWWSLPSFGIIAAAYITSIRLGVQSLLLAPGMGWPKFPNFKSPIIYEAWLKIKPLLIGATYYKTEPLLDRFLLSMANSGSLSIYFFVQQIYNAISQVLNKSIIKPLVPALSQYAKTGDFKKIKFCYKQLVIYVGILSIFIFIVICFISKYFVLLRINSIQEQSSHIDLIQQLATWLGGMFIGGVLGQISSTSFYIFGNTRTPTLIGIYSYTLFIPLKIVSFYYFGVMGIAAITSAFVLLNFFIQSAFLSKLYTD